MSIAFSSYCILIYDGLLYFGEEMVCLENALKTTKVYLFSVEHVRV